jgi:hypothetical protein
MVSELRYRQILPGTGRDEYLDTPVDRVAWMLAIDAAKTNAEAKRKE